MIILEVIKVAEETKKPKIKVLSIILAILLGISLLSLAGTLIYNHFSKSVPASVTVPDNIITPDNTSTDLTSSTKNGTESSDTADAPSRNTSIPTADADSKTTAPVIHIHNKNAGDNEPFHVKNMFPGDKESKYYCVKVSYHDKVALHFKADIHSGYEKLAEVMKAKITLLDTNEVMYDGLMKNMPKSVTHSLSSRGPTTDEVYYEITAYLDVSVGNEYMEKDLEASFKWWVEEIDHLDSPQTGESLNTSVLLLISSASLFMLILLLRYKKKNEEEQK